MIRTRFAPSPTGYLHLGNARTALFAALLARHDGGAFVLRVEDTDAARSRPEFEAAIAEDLEWLGLVADESPARGGPFGPYRQSERLERHRAAVDELIARGLAYPCYCTAEELELARREHIAAHKPPRYSGHCRELNEDERRRMEAERGAPAVRFRCPDRPVTVRELLRGEIVFAADDLDDVIIRRSDGVVSFLLASALDDADMEITHVLRGDDHLSNTPRQILMLEALGKTPPAYGHLGLVTGSDGRPLSKRDGALSVRAIREAGSHPHALAAALAHLGWNPPPLPDGVDPIPAFAEAFSLEAVSHSACQWDVGRYHHENTRAWRHAPTDVLVGYLQDRYHGAPIEKLKILAEILRPEISGPDDLVDRAAPFVADDAPADLEAIEALRAPDAQNVIKSLMSALSDVDDNIENDFRAIVNRVGSALGIKGRSLMLPVRAALTGRSHGPELTNVARLLGLREMRRRLERAVLR